MSVRAVSLLYVRDFGFQLESESLEFGDEVQCGVLESQNDRQVCLVVFHLRVSTQLHARCRCLFHQTTIVSGTTADALLLIYIIQYHIQ